MDISLSAYEGLGKWDVGRMRDKWHRRWWWWWGGGGGGGGLGIEVLNWHFWEDYRHEIMIPF